MQPATSLEELKERIDLFLLGLRHPILTEPGREVLDLSTSRYSLSTEYHKLLWHVWNEQINFVRQITGIQKETAGRMELRFQKFGKGPPGTLILAESRAAVEQVGLLIMELHLQRCVLEGLPVEEARLDALRDSLKLWSRLSSRSR